MNVSDAPVTGVAGLSPGDYATAITGALAAVAADAAALDVRPSYLQVSHNALDELLNGRPWHVSVQVDDVAAADTVAAHYSLPGDDETSPTNYTRRGVAVLTEDVAVQLTVYTARPAVEVTR